MGKAIERLARAMAVIGGVALTLLVILVCVSVLGRGGNTLGHSDWLTGLVPGLAEGLIGSGIGPVQGDFEIVEAGVAFAIFAFLPICQILGAHATVDVFTSFLSPRVNKIIIAFWEVILTGIIILITVRLYDGMMSKVSNGETTFLLQFPVWWAYAASFVASMVAVIVGIYCAIARVAGVITGKDYMPRSEGAVH
ncbi:TRAP transporter small permease [Actibacterium sp. XHP0104]|uniref:TRAP transporter small permease n=1 Tax=Actibacterium sp. XHP0104 TaxID=2984335 RepID=UPI0021E8AD14|nr:TRAP transporter small permease [Actibacterium sp. XHP0104]MCV2881458.1 TRAP transporter small permease [Actibacterium sp. XHP0104]